MFHYLAERLVKRQTASGIESDIPRQKSEIKQNALYPDLDAAYTAEYTFDASALEPMIACPHSVDNVKPLSQVQGTRVQQAFIGTLYEWTFGRYCRRRRDSEWKKGGERNASAGYSRLIPGAPRCNDTGLRANSHRRGSGDWCAGMRTLHGQSYGHSCAKRGHDFEPRTGIFADGWERGTPRFIWQVPRSWRRVRLRE